MRRLDGRVEAEKIIFGREILGLRRMRMIGAIGLCALILAVVLCAILLSARGEQTNDFEALESASSGAEGTSEREHDTAELFEEISQPTGGGEEDSMPVETESTTQEIPIVYKDFSTDDIEIVNRTGFNISYVDRPTSSLANYYDKGSKKPIVLILHTYTSDRYFDSSGRYGVCSVGQVICDELNAMGIGAVYSSAVHDGDLEEPRVNAAETIEFYLKMYPSIKYIFDVGVAQEYDGDRAVATAGSYLSESAAQIKMMVRGNNVTTGRDNLRLAYEISKNLRHGSMDLSREIRRCVSWLSDIG